MRKNLLFSLAAACLLFASVETKAQGQSCETAMPWTGMGMIMNAADFTDGAWYTVTIAERSYLGFGFSMNTGDIAVNVYKDCAKEEIPAFEPGNYDLEPGNYILKFNVANEATVMIQGSPMPLSGTPEGAICLKPIAAPNMITAIKPGVPQWYKYEAVISLPITISEFMPSGANIKILAAKHEDCYATANEANLLLSPNVVKVKKGINLLKVETDKELNSAAPFLSILGEAGYSSCETSHPEMMTSLTINTEVSYENAIFDYYWKCPITESGTYTITNKAPEGTILKIGELVENNDGKFACNFEAASEVNVGSENIGTVDVTIEAGKTLVVWSESFTRFTDNTMPSIKIEKSTKNNITSTKKESKDVIVTPNPSDGKFAVKSYLLKEGANVNVYDMAGNAIYRATAAPTNGEFPVQLDNVQAGTYLVLVIGKSKSASTKITIE